MPKDQLSTFLPSTRSDIFTFVCFTVTFVSVIGLILFVHQGSGTTSQKVAASFLTLIAVIGLSCGSSAMVIFGIRAARRQGISPKTVRTPLVGMVLCLFLALVSWYVGEQFQANHRLLEDMGRTLQQIGPPNRDILAPQLYSDYTRTHARALFLLDGTIMKYTTPEGQIVLYEPTEEERENRWRQVALKEFLALGEMVWRGAMYFWLSVGLLSTLMGLLIPMRKEA